MVEHLKHIAIAGSAIAVIAVAIFSGGLASAFHAAGLNVPFFSAQTQNQQASIVRSTLSIEDRNGNPVQGTASQLSTISNNGVDVTNNNLRTRMFTSFTLNSEAPIQQWTITGTARLNLNGNGVKSFQILMTGTSNNATNIPILFKDINCSTCNYSDSDVTSIKDLVKGVPLTFTGDLNLQLYLYQLQLNVQNTGGGTATAYATPSAGAQLSAMTLHQTGDPITPTVQVGTFTATSGETTLQPGT